jgi:uncharacterized protein (TIGR00251 family)
VSLALREVDGAVHFAVKVVPGASRTRIQGLHGDALKVQVAAPPEGGKANAAVVALLAEALGTTPNQVALVRGAGSPRKTIAVRGLTAGLVVQRLLGST